MHVLAICNPRAGRSGQTFSTFAQALADRAAQLTVRTLDPEVSVATLVKDAERFDRIVAVGGDGTISSVAYALRDSGIPVLAYPAGTGNLIALNLELPSDPLRLAELCFEGEVCQTDLGEFEAVSPEGCERLGFALLAGAGFDAELIYHAEPLKSSLGMGAYIAGALANPRPTFARFRIWLDGVLLETEGIGVMLVNFAQLQRSFNLAPSASAFDGLLEVVVLRAESVAGLLPMVVQPVLERLGLKVELGNRVEIHRAREVRVETDPTLPLQCDGEALSATSPFVGRILPAAASFLVEGAFKREQLHA